MWARLLCMLETRLGTTCWSAYETKCRRTKKLFDRQGKAHCQKCADVSQAVHAKLLLHIVMRNGCHPTETNQNMKSFTTIRKQKAHNLDATWAMNTFTSNCNETTTIIFPKFLYARAHSHRAK